MTQTAHAPTTAGSQSAEHELAAYHTRREQTVSMPDGLLAIATTQWVDAEQEIWGVPGRWLPDEAGLRLIANPEDDIRVDGQLVDGEVLVRAKDRPQPSSIVFDGARSGAVISNSEGGHALRVWDANSERLLEFGSIDIFPYNPEWVITATFTEHPELTTLAYGHVQDGDVTRDEVIPGEITFSKDGVDYNLAAYPSGEVLLLVFADATTGDDTYSVGRFLHVVPNPDGTITLDFNRAVLPTCAFNYTANCPIPPKQNRFPVRIEAGEKNVLKKDGSLLHQ